MTTIARRLVSQTSAGAQAAYDDQSAPFTGDWIKVRGNYTVQITGAATSISAVIERSTRDPAGTAGPNAATIDTITGNPSTGIVPSSYEEDGMSWVRWRVPTLNGAAHLSLAGKSWG